MKDALKWVLILGGGYLAWNWYENYTAASTASAGATGSPGVGPGPATTPASSSTPSTPASPTTPVAPGIPGNVTAPPNAPFSALATKVLTAAGGAAKQLTADQWNYYWSQVSGVKQSTDLFPAGNRGALLSFAQYIAARQAKNLGISGWQGRNYVPSRLPMRRRA